MKPVGPILRKYQKQNEKCRKEEMRNLRYEIFVALLFCFYFFTCESTDKIDDLTLLIHQLEGEFDNFQQAWQENTETDIHRVDIEHKHERIHIVFRKAKGVENTLEAFYYVNADSSQIVGKERYHFEKTSSTGQIISQVINPDNPKQIFRTINWEKTAGGFKGTTDQSFSIRIENDSLFISQEEGPFSNLANIPYRMLRCRFFAGWIEYPVPEIPDSTYRMGNLRLHDQGDKIQLILGDGTPVDYTVELTQLVFAHTIYIMKLAIYQEPEESVHYNSRAISYTWTNPEAKRMGINLRKVVSGWTLIEAGYLNSDNMKK